MTCPYCGEAVDAVKNHVRLASGNGHGNSGKYPDDFEGDDDPSDVEEEQEASNDGDESSEGLGGGEGERGEETAHATTQGDSDDSLVWYVGAGLVALYLVLTGQSSDDVASGSSDGPDVV